MPDQDDLPKDDQGAGNIVARLRKNDNQELVIALGSFKNHDYVDIRTYYGSRGSETRPTQKGVTIPVALYAEFRRLLEQLDDIMEEKGWG